MITHRRGALGLAVLLLAQATALGPALAQTHHRPGSAPTYRLGNIMIEAPWARATAQGAPVAGGFMRITNTGTTPDRLIGGSLVAAGRFEVHEMATVDGVMRMRPLARGLEIPAGQSVELRPGGYHVMFMQLRERLTQGSTVRGTLQFERAGTVEVEYRIESMGAGSGHAH